MNRVHSLALLLLLAVVGGHWCQGEATPQTGVPDAKAENVSSPTPTPPTTTTASPKTTPPPKTTTTPVPTTTTPGPTPPPTPKIISGNITEDNHTCIRYEFLVHFNIKYNDTKNATKETVVQLPLNSAVFANSGTCNASKESFSLSSKNIIFNLTFGSNENSVYLDSILLTVVYDNQSFPNIDQDLIGKNRTYTLGNLNAFNVEKTHSYFCANATIPKSQDGEVTVTFESLKLQAFMEQSQKGQFSSEHNCQNEINDVVPIAVGAALTGLVVIVMIAYFIGRRRSRRLAYQSV